MNISAIVAMGKNREIGQNNKLLWRIPDEMTHFKNLTMGSCLIMGRKTYESIGRPLPGRETIILTSDLYYKAPGCHVVQSREEAIQRAERLGAKEVFICGGEMVYNTFLPLIKTLHASVIDWEGQADAYFPEIESDQWKVAVTSEHPPKEGNPSWRYHKMLRQ
jgi:dihydrofolate reductase